MKFVTFISDMATSRKTLYAANDSEHSHSSIGAGLASMTRAEPQQHWLKTGKGKTRIRGFPRIKAQ
ncbi:hypothetical protein L573_0262 [Bordetella holmesii H620]|nr:hypothetical protein L573_0262 [Bordetella holmesii H620]KCV04217.1 hypothetical protein L498_0265 [Bordetella holmesii CDC-H629-BH]